MRDDVRRPTLALTLTFTLMAAVIVFAIAGMVAVSDSNRELGRQLIGGAVVLLPVALLMHGSFTAFEPVGRSIL